MQGKPRLIVMVSPNSWLCEMVINQTNAARKAKVCALVLPRQNLCNKLFPPALQVKGEFVGLMCEDKDGNKQILGLK